MPRNWLNYILKPKIFYLKLSCDPNLLLCCRTVPTNSMPNILPLASTNWIRVGNVVQVCAPTLPLPPLLVWAFPWHGQCICHCVSNSLSLSSRPSRSNTFIFLFIFSLEVIHHRPESPINYSCEGRRNERERERLWKANTSWFNWKACRRPTDAKHIHAEIWKVVGSSSLLNSLIAAHDLGLGVMSQCGQCLTVVCSWGSEKMAFFFSVVKSAAALNEGCRC